MPKYYNVLTARIHHWKNSRCFLNRCIPFCCHFAAVYALKTPDYNTCPDLKGGGGGEDLERRKFPPPPPPPPPPPYISLHVMMMPLGCHMLYLPFTRKMTYSKSKNSSSLPGVSPCADTKSDTRLATLSLEFLPVCCIASDKAVCKFLTWDVRSERAARRAVLDCTDASVLRLPFHCHHFAVSTPTAYPAPIPAKTEAVVTCQEGPLELPDMTVLLHLLVDLLQKGRYFITIRARWKLHRIIAMEIQSFFPVLTTYQCSREDCPNWKFRSMCENYHYPTQKSPPKNHTFSDLFEASMITWSKQKYM